MPAFTSWASKTPRSAAVCSRSWVSERASSSSSGILEPLKERLRSVEIEEIGQAGEGLPRVSVGGFAPFASRFGVASGGLHTLHDSQLYLPQEQSPNRTQPVY